MKTILALLLLTSQISFAEDFVGRLFGVGKTGETNPLYTQKVKVENFPDGTTSTTGVMLDSQGKKVMAEKAVYSGATLMTQELQNFLENKEYRASYNDKRVVFEVYSLEGNGEKKLLSSRKEKISSSLVTGPIAENFIKENWETLMKGKRVDFRFAVFERQETFGFSFKKKADLDVDGKPAVLLIMRPTSFFISMLVAPIEISVDKETKAIVRYKGRTPLKDEKDKNLDAEIVYDRHIPSISRNTASERQ